jgi:thioredoxin-dependent peroxiredoxin
VLGISPQDAQSHERWIASEGFQFPLLADVDKSVGQAYDIASGPTGYRRSVFVIDGQGVVRWRTVKLIGASWPRAKQLAAVIAPIVAAL